MGAGALRARRALAAQEPASSTVTVEASSSAPAETPVEAFTNDVGGGEVSADDEVMAAASAAHASSSHPAPMGAERPEGDGTAEGVVWASLDPRSGELQLYPVSVASRLEAAHRAVGSGRRRTVALQGLGGFFEDASVELGGDETPVQRTARGRRDVRRLEVTSNHPGVRVPVVHSRTWRIAEFDVPGVTEERVAMVSTANLILVDEVHDVAASSRERMTAVDKEEADGLAALWEWCRVADARDREQLPPEAWGLYGEEHEKAIEAAYREGKLSTSICVGIRTYDVVFSGHDAFKQVDRALNKRRFIRRRILPRADRESALRAASEAFAAANADVADGECAVCFADFAETPAIPVVRLPECGHCFHGACVQELADKNNPCPLCRVPVNWSRAFKPLVGRS